jgi:hypothetical protein
MAISNICSRMPTASSTGNASTLDAFACIAAASRRAAAS